MAEQRGFGRQGAKRGQGRGPKEEEWKPVTKLGRLVKAQKITTIEEIFRFAIPIKEPQIVDFLLKDKIKEEVMAVKPVQKQTQAGQRTRFQAYVIVGDQNGHIGLGWKVAKEVQGAIKGAILFAKLKIIPVRRGYWGNRIGNAHTVPCKVTGKCGSVRVRLVPAPRGTGLVAGATSKKIFQFAGIGDVYTSTRGKTKQKNNFIKAAYDGLKQTYLYLTPDLWGQPKIDEHPFEQHADFFRQFEKNQLLQQQQPDNQNEQNQNRRPYGRGNRYGGGDRGDRSGRGGRFQRERVPRND